MTKEELHARLEAEGQKIFLAAHWTHAKLARWRTRIEQAERILCRDPLSEEDLQSAGCRISVAAFESMVARDHLPPDIHTAYHEAGHAVVLHAAGMTVQSACIVQDRTTSGHVRIDPVAKYCQMVGTYAGFQAEELSQGKEPTHDAAFKKPQTDGPKILAIARAIAPDKGVRVEVLMADAFIESIEILEKNWLTVLAVVAELLEKKSIGKARLSELLNGVVI